MLYLLFRLGGDRYALATERVVEVLPVVAWRQLPEAPAGVRGLINYHGVPVPVLDLQSLALGAPGELRTGTRIVLVDYPAGPGESHLLGLLVQEANDFFRRGDEEFTPVAVRSATGYAGPVTRHGDDLVQRIELAEMVAPELWRRLSGGEA